MKEFLKKKILKSDVADIVPDGAAPAIPFISLTGWSPVPSGWMAAPTGAIGNVDEGEESDEMVEFEMESDEEGKEEKGEEEIPEAWKEKILPEGEFLIVKPKSSYEFALLPPNPRDWRGSRMLWMFGEETDCVWSGFVWVPHAL